MKKIIIIAIAIFAAFGMACNKSQNDLSAEQFVAACSVVEKCTPAMSESQVQSRSKIVKNDASGKFSVQTQICATRSIIGSRERGVCVSLTSVEFLSKQEVEDRKEELTFQNIGKAKDAFIAELQNLKTQ